MKSAQWKTELHPKCTISSFQNYLQIKLGHRDCYVSSEGLDVESIPDLINSILKINDPTVITDRYGNEAYNLYQTLKENGMLAISIQLDKEHKIWIEVLAREEVITSKDLKFEGKFKWSPFNLIRQVENSIYLESPLSKIAIKFNGKSCWDLLYLMMTGTEVKEITQKFDWSIEIMNDLLLLMMNHGLLKEDTEKESSNQDSLASWEFHDLYFHTRSRMGRHNNEIGGNYRFKGVSDPLPAVRPQHEGPIIKLPELNPQFYTSRDASFIQVMEWRDSKRLNGAGQINIYQVSEFLYRAARIRMVLPKTGEMEVTNRPYPNGGASYELELYLTVERCYGLNAGFYYYCPLNHHLIQISEYNQDVSQNMATATFATGQNINPPILINIAARFKRVSWKYQGIAYAIMLKNTGVMYHNLYLVATAMGLGPCGVGVGDSDHFSKITGLDYLSEGTIGELILNGSPNTIR